MEQELPILSEYLSSLPVLSGVRVALSLVFCVVFCTELFVFLAIVLSVLLRFTASDYSFGIFKLFFLSSAIFCSSNTNFGRKNNRHAGSAYKTFQAYGILV